MFDTHIHTHSSHDCEQEIDELCISAIEKGVTAVSFTDHIDVFAYTEEHNTNVICKSSEDADYANKTYGNKLKIFKGVEAGLYHYNADLSKKICDLCDLDIILGSVHSFLLNGKKIHFSRDDISQNAVSTEELIIQADAYFSEMLKTCETADIDVLCHLTYPLRYINAKYNRNLDINLYKVKITQILKTLIERQIALEINTARIGTDYNYTAPTFDIISEYKQLGGKLITIGSDAHKSDRIANGFKYVKKQLKGLGYGEYYYFEKRKPKFVKL